MKKIILVLLLASVLFVLASCTTKVIDENGIERESQYGLIVVDKLYHDSDMDCIVAYDPRTKICYMIIDAFRRAGVSPYYIIGEDGKPKIAVYGVNYE